MNARQLEIFHAVMRSGTITGAASFLGISQPAVSKAMHAIERRVGFKLLRPVKGRLYPTPEAQRLLPDADRIMSELSAFERLTGEVKAGGAGLVRVVASSSCAAALLPAAAAAFLKANPEAVKGFLRATVKGLKDVAADPELGVKAALAFEPLLNADIERERLRVAMGCCIVTDTVRKKGFGEVDKDRLQKVIEIITKAYNLQRQPALAEVYDGSYLPSAQDRMLK